LDDPGPRGPVHDAHRIFERADPSYAARRLDEAHGCLGLRSHGSRRQIYRAKLIRRRNLEVACVFGSEAFLDSSNVGKHQQHVRIELASE
jgi:hypothetical protein